MSNLDNLQQNVDSTTTMLIEISTQMRVIKSYFTEQGGNLVQQNLGFNATITNLDQECISLLSKIDSSEQLIAKSQSDFHQEMGDFRSNSLSGGVTVISNLENSLQSCRTNFEQNHENNGLIFNGLRDSILAFCSSSGNQIQSHDSEIATISADLAQEFGNIVSKFNVLDADTTTLYESLHADFQLTLNELGIFETNSSNKFLKSRTEIANFLELIGQSIDQLEHNFIESSTQFHNILKNNVDDFVDGIRNLFANLETDVTQVFDNKLKAVFQQVTVEIVAEVAGEIAQSFITMTVGAEVTTAMTAPIPILPALKTLQLQLEALNAILDTLSF
jgi:hypothetical protein